MLIPNPTYQMQHPKFCFKVCCIPSVVGESNPRGKREFERMECQDGLRET